jgi:hypothetical protein
MHSNKKLILIIGLSKLAKNFIELKKIKNINKIIISRRKKRISNKNNTIVINYKNKRKFISLINNYKKIDIINTSATYNEHIDSWCSLRDGNHLYPKKIIEIIPISKIKKIINIDTALEKYDNRYSIRKKKHSSWLKRYALSRKIRCINLLVESFYYLDGKTGSFIDYLYSSLVKNKEVKINNGENLRDFISANQVLLVIAKFMNIRMRNGRYVKVNISTGTEYRIREIPEILSKIFKKKFLLINRINVLKMKNEKKKKRSKYKLELLTGLKILNLEQDLRIRGEK